jgi:O-antigen/teichoic acid export membrane protein
MIKRLHQFRRWAGVDRPVFFSNAAQMMRLVTGPITMALVLRYLTPEIQGYFYAFSGVVAMQVFLEMGFSQNILQFASHEFAKLRFTSAQTLEGDLVAKSRLISLGRLAFGYYAVAALLVLLAIGIGGHIFFTISAHHDVAHQGSVAVGNAALAAKSMPGYPVVAWQGAWWIITVTAALSLAINPAWALLEGCNKVAVVAQFRFWAALAIFTVNALALIAGAGIYVSAIGSLCNLLICLGYLGWRWKSFFFQFLERPQHGQVSWAREIWPFQWRIAVSWMSGYFVFDIINPIAFYFCGPVEAGRLGMSFQLVRMIFGVAMSWVSTKAPRFGMLIAARTWRELDFLWRRSTLQAFTICLLGMSLMLVAIPLVGHLLPKVPARLAPFGVNVWLAGAMLVQILISSMAMELRAHKREPYVWLSVANAILSVAFILPLVQVWGIYGEALGYALAILAVLIPSHKIYRMKRLEYRRHADGSYEPTSTTLEIDPSSGGFP